MSYLFGIVATLIMMVGIEGRGSWSYNISVIGGILWSISIIYTFYIFSWQKGLVFLLATLVLGAILQRILRPLLNPHGH